jgi:hypothetical protein
MHSSTHAVTSLNTHTHTRRAHTHPPTPPHAHTFGAACADKLCIRTDVARGGKQGMCQRHPPKRSSHVRGQESRSPLLHHDICDNDSSQTRMRAISRLINSGPCASTVGFALRGLSLIWQRSHCSMALDELVRTGLLSVTSHPYLRVARKFYAQAASLPSR